MAVKEPETRVTVYDNGQELMTNHQGDGRERKWSEVSEHMHRHLENGSDPGNGETGCQRLIQAEASSRQLR